MGDLNTGALFSYVSCEARVGKDHPLRAVGEIVIAALAAMSPEFDKLYARLGRPSIAPEKLLRALLLEAFYSMRSERQLMSKPTTTTRSPSFAPIPPMRSSKPSPDIAPIR